MSEKVTVKVQIEMDADELWSRIFGAEPWSFGSWWRKAKYAEGTDWNKAGKITVKMDNPEDDDKAVTKTIGVDDLLAAIEKCPPHIVSDLIEDNMDCISADYIVQVAVLGECVYG